MGDLGGNDVDVFSGQGFKISGSRSEPLAKGRKTRKKMVGHLRLLG